MDLQRATITSLVLFTFFVLLEMYMYSAGLISQSTAMSLLGVGCALVCLPLLAALQRERREAQRGTHRQRIK